MAVVVLFDPEAPVPEQTLWALRFARARDASLVLLLEGKSGDVDAGAMARITDVVQNSPDYELREPSVAASGSKNRGGGEASGAEGDDADGPRSVCCRVTQEADTGELLQLISAESADLFVVLLQRSDPRSSRALLLGRELLMRVSCEVAVVRIGASPVQSLQRALVPTKAGAHAKLALRTALNLVDAEEGRVTACYVEPEIGVDAELVGAKVLDGYLGSALGDKRGSVESLVVVNANLDAGIDRAIEQVEPDLLVVGVTWPVLLGPRFHGTFAGRLARRDDGVPVIALRPALPLGNRLSGLFERLTQRFVPQMTRQVRVDLAQHVQSNSAWNFDFIALVSLSSLIAAMGLLQDSSAVVIGAMLVAPLMTPILGCGLALVQSNAILARHALRTIGYGVAVAFVLAFLVGLCDESFVSPTTEMTGRGWPGLLALLVAFVSGLAAAYAHARPNLIAAIPGVAIAASLVPPIATSGLAASLGDVGLAYGSMLLFVTNMIAIVLAAGIMLWIVGIRTVKKTARWPRHVVLGLIASTLLLGLYLGIRQQAALRSTGISGACQVALQKQLRQGTTLNAVLVKRGEGHVELVVSVAGPDQPRSGLASELRAAAQPFFDESLAVRLQYQWQEFAKPAPR